MRHLDLFSGIGGFALAAKEVWNDQHEIVLFCEIDKFCQQVLKKHWPEILIHEDIKTLNGKQWLGTIDLLTGGFPCQSFSLAGKRRGKDDDRYLWPEMFRIIKEARPRWIIGENVTGIINLALDDVLFDLENENYSCQTFIIPACAVGAPHRRDRIWIIGHSEYNGYDGTENCQSSKQRSNGNEKRQNEICKSKKSNCLWNATSNSDGEHGKEYQRGNQFQQKRSEEPLGWSFYEQTWEENWTEAATRLCRVDDGLSVELDFIGGINDYYSDKKSKSEIDIIVWEILCKMWEYRELAETSPDLYTRKLYHSVPGLPYQKTHGEWLLGKGNKENTVLHNLWGRFYAERQSSSSNVQQTELLEYIRKIERRKTMGQKDRVNRLKSLGNAIVPKIAKVLMEAIKQCERSHL